MLPMVDGADPFLSPIQYRVPPIKLFEELCFLTTWAVNVICVLDKMAVEREETTGRFETMLAVGINVGADVGTDLGADIEGV